MEDIDEKRNKVYLIYRIYSQEEIEENKHVSRYYGWTRFKEVAKAFTSQRDKKKYKVIEKEYINGDDLYDGINGIDLIDDRYMINYIKLESSKSDLEVTFLTTQDELHESEIKIQRMMIDEASLESIDKLKGSGIKVLELFINLKEKYSDLLYFIGYRPRDLEAIFSRVASSEDEIEHQIDLAYDGYAESPQEDPCYIPSPPGLAILDDISMKVIYSLEAFIKVLREDL